jgi:ABC-type multidrug transport system fused ATPase/permease subunit
MKKVWMMILALVLATVLCTAAAEAPKTEVVVFAAASMTETLTEIEALYEKANPEIDLIFNFDSSGTLKTQIQEGAVCDLFISAGQKQLITIARAMIDDAPILILDEATSSVDTRTERLISEAVDKLMEGRTGFVIAHRLSTIRNADMILVLKDGDIIENGTHEELMAKGGFYSDLYMSQFDNA